MKISQLQNFVAVIKYGSINKAAEKMFISQPSISRSIQALEKEMGKPLLVRSSHGVAMTPTGRLLYYYGQSIINEINTLERLKGIDEKVIYSKLSVSVNGIFLKDDLILSCYEKLVSNETEIQMMETTAEEVFENVQSSKSEIGILILNNIQLSIFKKMAEVKGIEVTILGTGPIYIHINEENDLAKKDSISFSELLDYTHVHLPADFFANLNNSIIIDGIQLSNFPKRLIMSNYHTMLNLVKRTKSFLVGNKWQVDELKYSHVKSLLLLNCDVEKNFVIIKRKNDVLSDAANIFLDVIKNNYENM